MLDAKFKSATGRGLTEDNMKFLAGKAFRLDLLLELNFQHMCQIDYSVTLSDSHGLKCFPASDYLVQDIHVVVGYILASRFLGVH